MRRAGEPARTRRSVDTKVSLPQQPSAAAPRRPRSAAVETSRFKRAITPRPATSASYRNSMRRPGEPRQNASLDRYNSEPTAATLSRRSSPSRFCSLAERTEQTRNRTRRPTSPFLHKQHPNSGWEAANASSNTNKNEASTGARSVRATGFLPATEPQPVCLVH
jgi:hypothetical protein